MSYIANVKPSIVKLCHQSGMAQGMHSVSPGTLIVYRKVWNAWHEYIYPERVQYLPQWFKTMAQEVLGVSDPAAIADIWMAFATPPYDPELAVEGFIRWLRPELQELAGALPGQSIAVEGLNETIACGAIEDIRRVVMFESAFARRLAALDFADFRPVVLNIAVGNPEHGAETEMLVPAVRAAVEVGGFVGYHAYWPSIGDRCWLENDWEHFAGRWAASWDPVFRAHGLRPHYLLTEGGPIGGTAYYDEAEDKWKPSLNAGAGWRSPDCNNGDWNKTLEQILTFDQLAHSSIPGQEGRYGGITLFTVGQGWEYFQHYRDQFESLEYALIR